MKKIFAIALILTLALSLLTACGGNNDNSGNNSTNPPASQGGNDTTPSNGEDQTPIEEHDEKLVLPDGQAWVDEGITTCGYIFKADGTYVYYDGTWTHQSEGTWSTFANELTIIATGINPYKYTYSISGDDLTMRNPFGDEYVFTKKAEPSGN